MRHEGRLQLNSTEEILLARIDPIRMAESAIIYQPTVTTRNEKISIGARSRVDAFCKLEGGRGLVIGEHVHIASFCHLNIGGGELIMEDGTAAGSGSRIVTGGNHHEALSISRSAREEEQILKAGRVILRKNSGLYVGVTVVASKEDEEIVIGEGARVGANSLVTKSIPPYELWMGTPAKRVGYYTLKGDGTFQFHWLNKVASFRV